MNLFDNLSQRFAAGTDRPFLCMPGREACTYADIEQHSARFAAVIRQTGATAGSRVMAQVEKSVDAVALYLACLRLGVVYVPLNPAYTPAELAHYLRDADPVLLVHAPRGELPAAPGIRCMTLGADGDGELAERARSVTPWPARVARSSDDIAAMLYTSGTTGRSKGAQLTIGNLASNARSLYACWGWRSNDVLLHALPVFHVHGLFVALHCAMLGASRVIFLPDFDTTAVLDALPAATVMMGVPTMYSRLLAEKDLTRERCGHMRLFISGSAPLPPRVFEEFAQRSGHRILERYGMTETGMIASNPLDGERVPGTVGFALPDVEIRIRDEQGCDLPQGQVGSVELRGPNVFVGYRGTGRDASGAFRADGFFVTGDLGSVDRHGRLSLAGRTSDLLICGGYNVYPRELEACIDAVPGVYESAVVGVPHADLGEVPAAAIVADPAGVQPDGDLCETVRAALRGELARFKQPRHIALVDALPRNAMGKIRKDLLREWLTGGS